MAQRSRKRGIPHKARQGLVNAKGERLQPQVKQVVIGVPCQDQCSTWFAYDLARLVGYTIGNVPNVTLQIFFDAGTLIGPQRQAIAEAAQQVGASHILWIDSDMRFPKESLQGLLKHNVPIVGANYIRRRPPHVPTAWARGDYLWTYDDSEGLESVDHLGMGLMLTETRVFADMPKPWFPISWSEERQTYRGEDVVFMEQARLAGFEVLVDQDLSKYVQHTGTMEYTYIHGLDAKEVAERVASGMEEDNGADNDVRDAADGDSQLAQP